MDATLQNFVYEHITNLENVQRNKKKTKREFTGHQGSSNLMSKSLYVKNQPFVVLGQLYLSMSKTNHVSMLHNVTKVL